MKTKVKDALRFCRRFFRANEAVSALEYAILVGVIVGAVAVALVTFSGNITTALQNIGSKVSPITTTTPTLTGPSPSPSPGP